MLNISLDGYMIILYYYIWFNFVRGEVWTVKVCVGGSGSGSCSSGSSGSCIAGSGSCIAGGVLNDYEWGSLDQAELKVWMRWKVAQAAKGSKNVHNNVRAVEAKAFTSGQKGKKSFEANER